MTSLLGDAVPRDFPFGKVSQMLCSYETEYGLTLSAYGYVRWAIDHYGYKCLFKNLMASEKVVGDYAKEALFSAAVLPDGAPNCVCRFTPLATYVSLTRLK